ncbi:MAG: hypothetical protein AAFY33_18215, partial [Cyanobacteria bacterium J06643_4]
MKYPVNRWLGQSLSFVLMTAASAGLVLAATGRKLPSEPALETAVYAEDALTTDGLQYKEAQFFDRFFNSNDDSEPESA